MHLTLVVTEVSRRPGVRTEEVNTLVGYSADCCRVARPGGGEEGARGRGGGRNLGGADNLITAEYLIIFRFCSSILSVFPRLLVLLGFPA